MLETLLILLILLKMVDVGTTYYWLNKKSINNENNFIMRHVLNKIGIMPTLILAFVAHTLALFYLYTEGELAILWMLTAVLTWVSISNTKIILEERSG